MVKAIEEKTNITQGIVEDSADGTHTNQTPDHSGRLETPNRDLHQYGYGYTVDIVRSGDMLWLGAKKREET